MKREFKDGLDFAKKMDNEDQLKEFRNRFMIQPNEIYMDGNSLGMASYDAVECVNEVVDVWAKNGIKMFDESVENGKYFLYHKFLGEKQAKLVNAKPEEVTIMTNTTINIHQGISTLYKPTKERYKILVDDLNFSTDRYAVDSQVLLKGYTVEEAVKVVTSNDGRMIDEDAIIAAMSDDVALIHLPSVLYRSAQLIDMEKVTKAAHERGILIGWDLCHSIGSVPHDFAAYKPDYAVWCNYKYMSAGPGCPAGFYLNERHFDKEPGLAGWHGNNKATQFKLLHKFDHEINAHGWQTGTQPVISMAPLEGTMKIFEEAGQEKMREKSLEITAYLMYLIDTKLTKYGYAVGNPRDDEKRGGHVSCEHDDAYRICLALKQNGVIPDFREPNVIRLAPTALYTSYEEVYQVAQVLEKIVVNKENEKLSEKRAVVI